MRRLMRPLAMVTLFLLTVVGLTVPQPQRAMACLDGFDPDLQVWVTCPGSPGSSGSDGGKVGQRVCTFAGATIPCYDPHLGTWYAPLNCYLDRWSLQPDPSNELWRGNTYGSIFSCSPKGAGTLDVLQIGRSDGGWTDNRMWVRFLWLPFEDVPPDPYVLAQSAVDQLNITAPQIGIVPEADGASVGVIGLPVWLWVSNAGPSVTATPSRPTATASLRGFSITAVGRVDRITWNMGDGKEVICHGAGTPYSDSAGASKSPDCGHTYTKTGTYTVTATVNWVIDWAGMGASGTVTDTRTDSVQITEGEVQVIGQC